MKRINLVKGAAALSILSLAAYGLMSANSVSASTTSTSTGTSTIKTSTVGPGHRFGREHEKDLTAAQIADRTAKMTAIKTALDAGDYSAWVTAVKAIHSDSPLLTEITSDKFSKYVEAIKLREQADTIMKDLGVNRPQGMHLED